MSSNITATSEGTSSSANELSAAKEHLEKCLQMLKAAKNDNEKMACLMLFTHLMKNNTSLTVDSSKVFEAIGPRFIVRLLKSQSVPEGCPVFMYKSLALSILASFTEKAVLFHPLITSNLRVIVEVFASHKHIPEASELCEDCLKILLIFSRTRSGCEHLLESNSIPIICQCVLLNSEDDALFEILKGILLHVPQKTWDGNMSELTNLLENLSKSFTETQELKKFVLCEKLVVILRSLCESNMDVQQDETLGAPGSTWRRDIRNAVRDILQSRCKVNYKHTALQLASSMVELLGIEWTIESDQKLLDLSSTKFWLLLLSIIKIELKIILEIDNACEIERKSDTLVACYKILERTIELMVSERNDSWSLSDEVVLQMHGILVESFECVIQFLINAGTWMADNNSEEGYYKRPIIVATVRVLCAWLSEETNALGDQVSKVLPIILDWARAIFEEGEDASTANIKSKSPSGMISYLLPPLCHLSADEKFCFILIEKEFHVTLTKYFEQLWQKQSNDPQVYPSSLITLCNVFLNFAVLQVDLVKTSVAFQGVLDSIMLSLPKMVCSNSVVLSAHFTLLGLLLFRHRQQMSHQKDLTAAQADFFCSVIDFLRQAQVVLNGDTQQSEISVSFQQEWHQVSELWFLSLQNLLACAKLMKPVKKVLDSSGWIDETKAWLKTCSNGDKNVTELKSAFTSIINLD